MLLLQQMIIMFLLMSVGFVGSEIGMITEETSKRLSAIVVNIANPAMILVSGISDERRDDGRRKFLLKRWLFGMGKL